MLRGLKDTLALLIVFLVSIPTIANANTTTTTTTTTPIPENQVVETETFDGGTNGGEQVTDIEVPPTENNLVKIDDTWEYYGGMDNYHMELEYQKHGGSSNDYTFTLPTDHDVYEVGFTIGAMNNEGEVTYNHNDQTTQTNTIDAQSGMDIATMYEEVVYNIYNQVDKFIDSFVITINDWSLVDNVEIKYIGTTTTTLNPLDVQRQANFASYGISETDNERGEREEQEAEVQQQIEIQIVQEAIEVEDNMAITGYSETDAERAEREARTNVVIVVGDEEVTFTEKEQNDGTIEREMQRAKNEELYGVALTDEQIERGDLELYDVEEEEIEEEFEIIELTEEEIIELEKEIEQEAKELELMQEENEMLEELGFVLTEEEFEELSEEERIKLEKEFEEYIETIIEIEEYIDELEDFETEIIVIEEDINLIDIFIDNDLFPPTEDEIEKDLESVQEQLLQDRVEVIEEVIEVIEEEILEEVLTEDVTVEEYEEIKEKELEELTEEEVELVVQVAEKIIEEIVEIEVLEEDIEIIDEEEFEQLSEEEQEVYEEELEEKATELVETLEVEELVTVVEQVTEVGVENLDTASKETIAVVQAVVTEIVEEELTEEQVEVVADVLGFEETKDVAIIATAVATDEIVAQAVNEFVERAVDANVENFSLADATTEIAFETLVAGDLSVIVDIDFEDIKLSEIGSDLTTDTREKAQEVIVPTILVRIVGFALRKFD